MKRKASTTTGSGNKRPKNIQACSSCRKHKTRCEILEDVKGLSRVECHRCKVLQIECSYSSMDKSLFDPPSLPERLHVPAPPTTVPNNREEYSFPPKPHTIWSFFGAPRGSLDWSAPVQAILDLSRNHHPSTSPPSPPLPPLTEFNSQPLLHTFSQKYIPWLNFTPIRDEHEVLDLVCCTIASRDEEGGVDLLHRLQALTRVACRDMMDSQPTTRAQLVERVQCLLVLSLWGPISSSSSEWIADSTPHTLINAAVTLAMKTSTMEEYGPGLYEACEREPSDDKSLDETRLWMALTNTESMLCLGTSFTPISSRNPKYTSLPIFALTTTTTNSSPFPTLTSARDLRLRLTADLFDIISQGRQIPLFHSLDRDQVDKWYDGLSWVFSSLARVGRLILPLGVISDYDAFYFYMLNILMRSSRLLLLYHAIYSARAYFHRGASLPGSDNPFWFREVRPHGLNIIISWGKEALHLSEGILVAFLEATTAGATSLLSTTPDVFFSMLSFSAGFLVGVKFLILHNVGVELPGSGEKLLKKSMERLRLSYSGSNDKEKEEEKESQTASGRCERLIKAMVGMWEEQVKVRRSSGGNPNPNIDFTGTFPIPFSTPSTSASASASGSGSGSVPSMGTPAYIPPYNTVPSQMGMGMNMGAGVYDVPNSNPAYYTSPASSGSGSLDSPASINASTVGGLNVDMMSLPLGPPHAQSLPQSQSHPQSLPLPQSQPLSQSQLQQQQEAQQTQTQIQENVNWGTNTNINPTDSDFSFNPQFPFQFTSQSQSPSQSQPQFQFQFQEAAFWNDFLQGTQY